MKKLLSLFGILFVFGSSIFGQVIEEKAIRVKQEKKIADYMYAKSHYYTAIEYYKEVVREKPEDRYGVYWLGMSYLKARDYENAETYLAKFQRISPEKKQKRVEKENKTVYALSHYHYGEALKHNAKYDEAIKQFGKFKSIYDLEDKEDWNAKANNQIKGAELAIEIAEKSPKVRVESLGEDINTAYEEASPVFINDSTIYFTSLNEDNLIFIDNRKDIPPYKMYQSSEVDGVWGKGKKLPSVFQDEKFGTGNAAISEDGNRLYFCKCWNNEVDEIICNIYLSKKSESGKWSEAEKLNSEINSPKFTSTQPAVRTTGDDMDIVYFISDREGGKGGMDVWYFMRTSNGGFKGPRLVKGTINTVGDELTPFYDNFSETLYFSSNGHPSIGGFDVFSAQDVEDLGWSDPQNMGMPINSTADDLYYTRKFDDTEGYLVSNREGTEKIGNRYTGDDLYAFSDYKYGLEGYAFLQEKEGESILSDATVKLFEIDSVGNEILLAELEDVSDKYFFDLKPDRDYKVAVEKSGFSTQSEFITTKNLMDEDTLNRNLTVDKTLVIASGNVFDDKTKEQLDDAIISLVEILPNGEKKQISTTVLDAENPDFNLNLKTDKNYELIVNKDGYFKNTLPINTNNLGADVDTINRDVFLTMIEKDKTYELENILYDFNKSNLRAESKLILDNLVQVMNDNPTIKIELASHTDAKGSDEYNETLSQARAQSCVDYLIEEGIAKDRMTAKGYGESKPIAPNQNDDGSDNPEGRQKNRRTEFKVISL